MTSSASRPTPASGFSPTPFEWALGIAVHIALFTVPALLTLIDVTVSLPVGATFMCAAPVLGAVVVVLLENRRTTPRSRRPVLTVINGGRA